MTTFTQLRQALVARLLDDPGEAPREQRRAAFDDALRGGPLGTLVTKVARHAFKVSDEDLAAARAAGHSEDQVFELVVCAAVGQASRQYDAARAALDAATKGGGHAPRDPR